VVKSDVANGNMDPALQTKRAATLSPNSGSRYLPTYLPTWRSTGNAHPMADHKHGLFRISTVA